MAAHPDSIVREMTSGIGPIRGDHPAVSCRILADEVLPHPLTTLPLWRQAVTAMLDQRDLLDRLSSQPAATRYIGTKRRYEEQRDTITGLLLPYADDPRLDIGQQSRLLLLGALA